MFQSLMCARAIRSDLIDIEFQSLGPPFGNNRLDPGRIVGFMWVGLDLGHPRHIGMPLGKKFDQRVIDPVDLKAYIILGFTFGWQFCGGHDRVPSNIRDAGVHRQPMIFNHLIRPTCLLGFPGLSGLLMCNLSELC